MGPTSTAAYALSFDFIVHSTIGVVMSGSYRREFPAARLQQHPADAVFHLDDSAERQRRASDAPEAGPRLDQRTHLDEARARVTLREYGSGVAEVGWSFLSAGVLKRAARGESANAEANLDRATRRARSRLRHRVLAAKADHLLTLTYRANVADLDRAASDLSKFVRLVRARKPGWVYIAVAERQARGAWHWHLAVRGRQDVALLRATWRRVVGEGNIDVSAPKAGGYGGSLALVRYLGKYLAKGFSEERDLNARRFRSSLGIDVPAKVHSVPPGYPGGMIAFALDALNRAAGSIGHVWQSDDRASGWACSWK